MNIALVVYSHYSRDARVRRYVETLSKNGFRIDVVSLKEDYYPKESNISLIKYPIPRRRFGRFWYILEYLLFFVYSFIALTLNYFSKKYKIIHINNIPDVLVFTAVIPKLLGAKIILDMHDPMPELYMSKYHALPNNLIIKLLKWLEGLSFQFADQILTANDAFKTLFLNRHKLPGGKISVILNCPDPLIFESTNNLKPTTNNQRVTLLYMGTVEERFGLDTVLEAMPELIKHIPAIQFIVIPKLEEEGGYLKNLELKIMNYELTKYVQILKPLPLEKIAQELKKADIGIVLAKNGIFTENIFPVKLLEFIQMNIPVIATKTKVLSQYFNDNQIYFLKRNSSSEFAKAVIDLYKDKKLRQNLSKNAKLYLKEYNWTKEEKKYLTIIDSLAKPI